jgi:AcrR family transcriptional regulator
METVLAGRPQQVTDDEIFDAVAKTITEQGPSGATMNRIAANLGLTGPALAHRFRDKRGLMLAFSRRQPSVVADLFEDQRQQHDDPLEVIVGAYIALAGTIATKDALSNNLAFLHLDLTDPEFGEQAARQSRALKRLTAELITEIQPDLSGEAALEIATDIYITWNGAVLAWAIDGTGALSTWIEHQIRRALKTQRP